MKRYADFRMDDDDFAELFKKLGAGPSTGTSWRDVGAELEALGKTLGDAVREAWQRDDTQAGLAPLRDSLQSLLGQVERAFDGTPEGQQARDQLVRLTESIRSAAARA